MLSKTVIGIINIGIQNGTLGTVNSSLRKNMNMFTVELALFPLINNMPYPIFIALSEKYREIRFKVKFADQYAFGCDCGFLVFQNGLEIDCHVSPNEFESDEQYSYWLDIAMNV
ncbi:hypothetical protein [Vibrio diabolicus]|uniref:DUF1281 family ferredoxin-like fold protein n=1 Tax=Vibrio diabolicus TaxID=50719 RepID=UPI00249576DD|nr:hypothetical protein [Vibrio diabolicus]